MPRQSDLRFAFEVVNGPHFGVVEFEHEEALSECFTLSIDLYSTDPAVDFGRVLDQPALLTIWRGDEPVRYVHGIVHAFVQGETGFRRTRYSATVRPDLTRADLYSDWRIHQQVSIPQLLDSRIKELGITNCEQRMYGEHLTREYCVQSGETTLHFLDRIAAEEGVYSAYSHSAQGHRLIMGDRLIIHGAIAEPVIYNATPAGDQKEPFIWKLRYGEQLRTSRVTQRDYFFRNPRYHLEHSSDGANLEHQGRAYEKYHFPGRYKYDAAARSMTLTRQLAERRDAQMATIEGDDARLTPGVAFKLEGHSREEWNRSWRPVHMVHKGKQHVSLEEESADSGQSTTYSYEALIIPDDVEWKAPLLPKPVIDGPQIAIVTGPDGEEIFCDEFARVKVRFPWDRANNLNEQSTCWIRVAQNWAGATWGHVSIPRIGQEVIVAFIDGDCDQPLIIGRTYNALNLPPYELPRHKTRMTIKSQTHKGEGHNELRFEDEAGQEEIYFHAQKDQNIHVNHDETRSIGNDQRIGIGRDRQTDIGQDEIHSTARDRKDHVGQDVFTTIDRNEVRKVGNTLKEDIAASHLVTIGENETLVIEGTLSTEAKTALRTLTRDGLLQAIVKLVVRGPNGSITLDQAGITLKSPVVRIDGQLVVNSPTTDQVQAIESAIHQGLPVIEECPLAGTAAS
ncbi:MAG: type VI secretion system tip protein TssI/VgrG [Paraburkholderia tropica]|uniref:type VI secretion system Vgr family protein n=1 Tax=Paraburkholderia tropica TaxID=92647 RepID=UPI001590E740|nr:type VI secretion system tip protein TssI/VgrG [Paraburkholderia tropica]MDE1143187.1 type VI secretion system tip protein TssI/VgrG [Paraburkholderia tropica]